MFAPVQARSRPVKGRNLSRVGALAGAARIHRARRHYARCFRRAGLAGGFTFIRRVMASSTDTASGGTTVDARFCFGVLRAFISGILRSYRTAKVAADNRHRGTSGSVRGGWRHYGAGFDSPVLHADRNATSGRSVSLAHAARLLDGCLNVRRLPSAPRTINAALCSSPMPSAIRLLYLNSNSST